MKRRITYVFPIFNESGNISTLYNTLHKLLEKYASYEYELIFVNDGSRDDSLQKLLALQKKDRRVIVANLSRNFGHQKAVTAGLDLATGDAVIIMDSDMQDPPAVSFELIKQWEKGYDVVYAQRRTRKDSLFKRATAHLFYRILRQLAVIEIPPNTGDFRLLDRRVVEELKKFGERERFLRGMAAYVGFKQIGVLFDREERLSGQSNYPLKKMWKLAVDGILGFSSVPLKFISGLGFFFALVSFLGIVYALLAKLLEPAHVVPGWAFIVISVLLMGGVQLMMLGVLGGYIGRIYTEIQHRPLYIISEIYGNSPKKKNSTKRR